MQQLFHRRATAVAHVAADGHQIWISGSNGEDPKRLAGKAMLWLLENF